MAKFRKKPVVISAWQVTDLLTRFTCAYDDLPGSVKKALTDPTPGRKLVFNETHIIVQTLEGDMRAERGDWLIKGVQGEFYPCKPSVFAETYEPA